MKTTKRDKPNKAWEKQKEESKRINRYLKVGGRPVVRKTRQRGPNDGSGKPTWYEAGTETAFPEAYNNFQTRRDAAKERRQMNRIFKKAERTGHNPLDAVKRFLSRKRGKSLQMGPQPGAPGVAPRKPNAAPKKDNLFGKIRNLFKRKGDR